MDSPKEKSGWNDDELEASVDAYLKMLRLEQSGQTLNKKLENQLLREGPLSKRSASSVEYRKRKAFLEEIKHAIESEAELYCFFYGVTPALKQVPSKKNPEQTFGVFSADIENLDHFIVREAPGLEG